MRPVVRGSGAPRSAEVRQDADGKTQHRKGRCWPRGFFFFFSFLFSELIAQWVDHKVMKQPHSWWRSESHARLRLVQHSLFECRFCICQLFISGSFRQEGCVFSAKAEIHESWSDRWILYQDQREATDSWRAPDEWKQRQRSPPADGLSVVMHAALLQFSGKFWHGRKQICYIRKSRAARTKWKM